MADPHDLARFVAAQEGSYAQALAEVRAGAKRSHWMWYVFPQVAGLGSSAMARAYAIAGLDDARAYLAHPVLGPRYLEIVATLQALDGNDAGAVFGGIDALKLRSSLTLFDAAGAPAIVGEALARWCDGPDPATLDLLPR